MASSKLVPLLREGADDVERMLLASARQDGPPDTSARDRTLAAVKAASGTAAIVGSGAVLGRWLATIKTSTAISLAVGGIGVAAAIGGATVVTQHHSRIATHDSTLRSPATTVAAPSALAAQATAAPPRMPVAVAPAPAPSSPATPSTTATTRIHPPATAHATAPTVPIDRTQPTNAPPVDNVARVAAAATQPVQGNAVPTASVTTDAPAASESAAPAAPPVTSLRREAALLEAARESLAASHVDRALSSLDEYDARFPSGTLAEEAAVLRVEALLAAGKRAAADAKLADFARRYPGSSYGPRVRALAGKK